MMLRAFFLLIVVLIFLFAGFSYFLPRGALDSVRATIGAKEVTLFIADEPHERARGLMNVKTLKDDEGMLFVFEGRNALTFWNKNLLIPLDVIWIRDNTVLGIDVLPPEAEGGLQYIYSPGAVDIVLEMNESWSSQNGIDIGSIFVYD